MSARRDTTLRAVTVAAVVVHAGAIAAYGAQGLVASDPVLDPLRPIPIAAIYATPALLALAGLRSRHPLLLVAAIAAGILAVFPFSLHSFLLAPVGLIYGIAYAGLATAQHRHRSMVAVAGCPLLLVAAFIALVVHEDPVCYEKLQTGEIIIDRDPDNVTSRVDGPDSDVIEGGCTGDTVVWWEATVSLALTSATIVTALLAVPKDEAGERRRTRTDRPPEQMPRP